MYEEVVVRLRARKPVLDHTHILPLRDLGWAWAARVQGRPLETVLETRYAPFSPAAVMHLTGQASDALAHLHEHKCLHCIHTRNVFYHNGILQLVDAPEPSEGSALHVRAPEVVVGQPRTPAADIWALGCLVYSLATRRDLFCFDAVHHPDFAKFKNNEWEDVRSHFAEDMVHLAQMQGSLGSIPWKSNRMFFSAKRKLCCSNLPHCMDTSHSAITHLVTWMVQYTRRPSAKEILRFVRAPLFANDAVPCAPSPREASRTHGIRMAIL